MVDMFRVPQVVLVLEVVLIELDIFVPIEGEGPMFLLVAPTFLP